MLQLRLWVGQDYPVPAKSTQHCHMQTRSKHPLSLRLSVVIDSLMPSVVQITLKDWVRTAKKTKNFTIIKLTWLMQFQEVIAVYSENRKKHVIYTWKVTNYWRNIYRPALEITIIRFQIGLHEYTLLFVWILPFLCAAENCSWYVPYTACQTAVHGITHGVSRVWNLYVPGGS
jgi:hypothetical protein